MSNKVLLTANEVQMSNGHLQFLFLAVICVFLILTSAILYLFYRSNKRHQRELLELGRYSTNVQAVIDETIPGILHALIDDCFNDYKIMHLVPRHETFITDEREKEIRNDLVAIVVARLSPMALDKISLFYNIQKIDEIIADKVYITVMDYVVAQNDVIGNERIDATKDARIVQ